MRRNGGYAARWKRLFERSRRAVQIQDLSRLIRQYFGFRTGETAIHAAWVLSGMDPDARELLDHGRYGLFQLTPLEAGLAETDGELLLDPIRSCAAARALVVANGWARFPPCPIPSPTQHPEDVAD
jgi:hypothetical protein